MKTLVAPLVLAALGWPLSGAAAPLQSLTPVPFTVVHVRDTFWTPRMETNRVVTVWYDFQKCEETGRIDNFAKAGKLMQGPFRGTPFDDSDVFKVIEGAAYTLAIHPDLNLGRYLDGLITKIDAAQEADGYLYTARTIDPQCRVDFFGPERWSNLAVSHELYNVGHLYEAAVAHFMATGKRSLLNVALKNADLICKTFGPAAEQRKDPPGHQEIEIGLVKLYRITGDRKYLDQAKFFLDQRGRAGGHKLRGPSQQDHRPVLEQDEAVGHAVRAGYMYAGMADVAALAGDAAYLGAIDRIWENVVTKKLYLTGGIGARHGGEAFGENYELPNASAYNETCAAIANALWNHRMFLLHGDARFLDVLERVLYNGFLSGVALSGDKFFYPNPLEADGKTKLNHGAAMRQPWFGCACCPVNVVRFVPSIAGCFYATQGNSIFVNLYATGSGEIKLEGQTVKLTQQTRYPWDGKIKLTVEPQKQSAFAIRLRVPGWAQGKPVPSDLYRYLDSNAKPVTIRVNGRRVSTALEKGFAEVCREWKRGDSVELDLPMAVCRVLAHEAVQDDAGRIALERGPIVYCVEGADHNGHVRNLVLPDDAQLRAEHRKDLLGGVTVIRGQALAARKDKNGSVCMEAAKFTAIPYYAWNHRGANEMTVWLPRTVHRAQPLPPPSEAATQ
jgi:hypothetical protein